ncbi:MAG: FAD-dependent oxidoreductase, partial [Chloroflexota bacterium]
GDFPAFIDSTSSAGCPMLVAFLTGDQVRRMADDAEPFIERATEVLKKIFPDSYQDPTAVHVTNWGKDPFSRGSYSTPAIGVSAKDYEQLAQPVAGRVLFAGEATYREHAGFVEGAMGSGIREARRILGREVDLFLKPH